MSDFIYQAFTDRYGIPMWSCARKEGGICGYGYTQEQAQEAFLDLEDQLAPLPTQAERETEWAINDQLHAEAFGDGN